MVNRKIKISEGDIFILPLKNGSNAVGLVARSVKNSILAYYFNKIIKNEAEFDSSIIDKKNTLLVQMVSTLGFSEGNWGIIEKLKNFK